MVLLVFSNLLMVNASWLWRSSQGIGRSETARYRNNSHAWVFEEDVFCHSYVLIRVLNLDSIRNTDAYLLTAFSTCGPV